MAGHFTFQPGSSASSHPAGLLISGSAHTLLLQGQPAHDHALDRQCCVGRSVLMTGRDESDGQLKTADATATRSRPICRYPRPATGTWPSAKSSHPSLARSRHPPHHPGELPRRQQHRRGRAAYSRDPLTGSNCGLPRPASRRPARAARNRAVAVLQFLVLLVDRA